MFSQASVGHSVHKRPHGYSVTTHPCYSAFGTHPTGMLSCLLCNYSNVSRVKNYLPFFNIFGKKTTLNIVLNVSNIIHDIYYGVAIQPILKVQGAVY